MRKVAGSAALVIVVSLAAFTPASAWTPPIGIPSPSFGINEVAPAVPNPWTSEVPGFYYVNNETGTGNPTYGTPANPRPFIPLDIPAGSVVEVHGKYPFNHASPFNIRIAGTAAQPVFIRGASSGLRPLAQRAWQVSGTYFIIENIEFGPHADGANTGSFFFVAPVDHGVLRHNELHGTPTGGGGVGVATFTNANWSRYVVIWDNFVHDNGDVSARFDQDVHGVSVGAQTEHLWIIDNEIARNSGDAVQLNGGSLQSTLNHVYIGRNHNHGNKQTGGGTKQAVDVIYSQNTVHNHRASNSSQGGGFVCQYGPTRVWFLFNHIYDNESGIRIEAASGLGAGGPIYYVGNLIHGITDASLTPDPENSVASRAIAIRSNAPHWIVNNTLWDYQAGIGTDCCQVFIENNILGGRQAGAGRDIWAENASVAAVSTMRNNIVSTTPRLQWGGSLTTSLAAFQAAIGKGENSIATDTPGFVASGSDFHLSAGSAAIDGGIVSAVYKVFFDLYGIDIAKDIVGTPRPQGSRYDLGAYEFTTQATTQPTPPAAPTQLQVR